MRPRFDLVAVFFVVISLVGGALPVNTANAACLTTDKPALAEFMVTQGVGDTPAGTSGYTTLTRGKETLVKLFLTGPSTCTLKITNASLVVTILGTTYTNNTLFTSFASTPSLPSAIQGYSPADPVFVVPSATLAPAATSASFIPSFKATIFFSRSDLTTGQIDFTSNAKTFEQKTNALRVYVVPMGDKTKLFNTQYTPTDQTIVQNAMQTLSRVYPTPAGVADLSGVAPGGIRYVVDTATMVDLSSISGVYIPLNGSTKFCGTSVNFSAIKGLLAQYLLTHNKANKAATADRVVGVIGGNGSLSGPLSFGSESGAGCADGMASVSSAESWIRLVADQPAAPSRSGAILSQEVAHTFALEQTPSYHSPTIQADSPLGTAAPGTDRAYNVVNRSRIQYDHSVMNYNNTDSLWDNTSTLLEPGDFTYLLCQLAPATLTTGCPTPGKIGTSTGVAAGQKYIIAGTTDGTFLNTKVIEPYYELDVAPTDPSDGSLLRLVQLDMSTSPPTVKSNVGVPWSPRVTHEGTTASTVQTFYASADGFTAAGAGEVRLVKVKLSGDEPRSESEIAGSTAVTLFSSHKIDPPAITSITGAAILTSGGSATLLRTQITPRIPPKPDIVFLADTTGSMGTALTDVRTNAARIMGEVRQAQPDAWFAAASYKDEPARCPTDPYDFRVEHAATSDMGAISSAITPNPDTANSGWQTAPGQGCDVPEAQLNALYQLGATAVAGFRPDSSRIVVWFGDAIGHDPSEGHTLGAVDAGPDDVIAALKSAGIRVIAVNIAGADGSLDQTGQASAIATATGGVVKQNNDYLVTQAILDGLHDLDATVTPWYNGYIPGATSDQCVFGGVGGPLSVRFVPAGATVKGGTSVDFTEQVTVAPASAGTYTCRVYFKINGRIVQKPQGDGLVDDPAYFQDISLVVSDQQQTTVTVKAAKSFPTQSLLLDLVFECNTFNFVAAVAVLPSQQTDTEATFTTNADTTNACAEFGGGGKLAPYVSDGWNRVGGTELAYPLSVPKDPTAAIYNPALGAAIGSDSTLALRGSGQVAGIELPGSALEWSITNGTITIGPEHGNSVDVPAPTGGWTQGTWTITLTVTYGTTRIATTRTFVVYQFLGFFSPVSNPPLINKGTAGKTFVFKWQLKSGSTIITDLSTVASTTYALATACNPSAAATFARTSGQSILRFDPVTRQFLFNWQTPSTPAPQLYLFRLTLSDGSTHDACVNLTK